MLENPDIILEMLSGAVVALAGAIVWMARWFVGHLRAQQAREDAIHELCRDERAELSARITQDREEFTSVLMDMVETARNHKPKGQQDFENPRN